ncbi:MAG TPA: hypothetical protein PKC18_18775 [Lacipirellulaceae bacterium]|nr:hypothetical protein [Lacipirellulaceae bacterium]
MIPSCSKNKQETLLKGSDLGEKTHSRGVRFTWKSTAGAQIVAGTPEQFGREIAAEYAVYRRVAAERRIWAD